LGSPRNNPQPGGTPMNDILKTIITVVLLLAIELINDNE
jgi:hypothetical protein